MQQVELDGSVIEILTFERVVRRVLNIESGIQLPPADCEGALREQRTEARAAAAERAHRFVEGVRHAAARGSQGERGELRGHLGVEALDDRYDRIVQLARLDRAEVRDMSKPRGQPGHTRGHWRALEHDLPENEVGQELRKRDMLGASHRWCG